MPRESLFHDWFPKEQKTDFDNNIQSDEDTQERIDIDHAVMVDEEKKYPHSDKEFETYDDTRTAEFNTIGVILQNLRNHMSTFVVICMPTFVAVSMPTFKSIQNPH